jgi:hypothetical protein
LPCKSNLQVQSVCIIGLIYKLMIEICCWMALLRSHRYLFILFHLLLLSRIPNVRAALVSANQFIPSRIESNLKSVNNRFPILELLFDPKGGSLKVKVGLTKLLCCKSTQLTVQLSHQGKFYSIAWW